MKGKSQSLFPTSQTKKRVRKPHQPLNVSAEVGKSYHGTQQLKKNAKRSKKSKKKKKTPGTSNPALRASLPARGGGNGGSTSVNITFKPPKKKTSHTPSSSSDTSTSEEDSSEEEMDQLPSVAKMTIQAMKVELESYGFDINTVTGNRNKRSTWIEILTRVRNMQSDNDDDSESSEESEFAHLTIADMKAELINVQYNIGSRWGMHERAPWEAALRIANNRRRSGRKKKVAGKNRTASLTGKRLNMPGVEEEEVVPAKKQRRSRKKPLSDVTRVGERPVVLIVDLYDASAKRVPRMVRSARPYQIPRPKGNTVYGEEFDALTKLTDICTQQEVMEHINWANENYGFKPEIEDGAGKMWNNNVAKPNQEMSLFVEDAQNAQNSKSLVDESEEPTRWDHALDAAVRAMQPNIPTVVFHVGVMWEPPKTAPRSSGSSGRRTSSSSSSSGGSAGPKRIAVQEHQVIFTVNVSKGTVHSEEGALSFLGDGTLVGTQSFDITDCMDEELELDPITDALEKDPRAVTGGVGKAIEEDDLENVFYQRILPWASEEGRVCSDIHSGPKSRFYIDVGSTKKPALHQLKDPDVSKQLINLMNIAKFKTLPMIKHWKTDETRDITLVKHVVVLKLCLGADATAWNPLFPIPTRDLPTTLTPGKPPIPANSASPFGGIPRMGENHATVSGVPPLSMRKAASTCHPFVTKKCKELYESNVAGNVFYRGINEGHVNHLARHLSQNSTAVRCQMLASVFFSL